MQVTFQLKGEDRKAFQRAVKLSPGYKLRILVPLTFLLVGLPFLLRIFDLSSFGIHDVRIEIGALMPPLLAMLALIGVLWAILESTRKARFTRVAQGTGPLTVETAEEGISGTTRLGRETLFWHAFHQIIETDTYFFVLRAPKSGFIIPKRAFDSPAQCAEFSALLQRKWAEHHPNAAPIASAK